MATRTRMTEDPNPRPPGRKARAPNISKEDHREPLDEV